MSNVLKNCLMRLLSTILVTQVEVIAEGDYSNELYIIVHGELQARSLL